MHRSTGSLPLAVVPLCLTSSTVRDISTNLCLSEELAGALRKEAARRAKSQQEIGREAIAKELGMASELTPMERAVRAGTVEAPEPSAIASRP